MYASADLFISRFELARQDGVIPPRLEVNHARGWFVRPLVSARRDVVRRPLPAGGQAPTPPPTSAISCIPPVPGPDWICQDGGWLPLGHPLIRPSGETPPPPPPPTSANNCIPPAPGPEWVCVTGGNWVQPDHPLALLNPLPPPPPPSPPPDVTGGPPGTCLTPDPYAGAGGRFGLLGLFGLCMDGDWVPIGHPLANDYLGRPLATDYSGIYTLTLITGDCTAEVPDVMKQRVYTARIEQNGATVQVFLSGADFLLRSNSFTGIVVSTDQIRFSSPGGASTTTTAIFPWAKTSSVWAPSSLSAPSMPPRTSTVRV